MCWRRLWAGLRLRKDRPLGRSQRRLQLAMLAPTTEHGHDLAKAFREWERNYWRPLQVNREFASHFKPGLRSALIAVTGRLDQWLMRSSWATRASYGSDGTDELSRDREPAGSSPRTLAQLGCACADSIFRRMRPIRSDDGQPGVW